MKGKNDQIEHNLLHCLGPFCMSKREEKRRDEKRREEKRKKWRELTILQVDFSVSISFPLPHLSFCLLLLLSDVSFATMPNKKIRGFHKYAAKKNIKNNNCTKANNVCFRFLVSLFFYFCFFGCILPFLFLFFLPSFSF